MTSPAIPLFRFGNGASGDLPNALPLAIMSGLLLFDSGEADHTFLFRCQDRYLTYNSLCGFRTVLFVADDRHRRHYVSLIARHNDNLRLVRQITGLPLSLVPQPLFVPVGLDTLQVADAPFFAAQLHDPEIAASIGKSVLLCNQISPTTARIAAGLDALLATHGCSLGIDARELAALGQAAFQWHNKAYYVRRVQSTTADIPPHAATALFSPADFLGMETWTDLVSAYTRRTGHGAPSALYVKSAFDSGGNVAARLSRDGFAASIREFHTAVRHHILRDGGVDEDLAELEQDVDIATSLRPLGVSRDRMKHYLTLQRGRRQGIEILVQEAIEAPSGTKDLNYEGLGITCDIEGPDRIEVIVAAGQLYHDRERRHFLGSYVDEAFLTEPRNARLIAEVRCLCSIVAQDGYRGPVNFDARRDPSGAWVFIYDCNPRLSAVYPALAVRQFLLGLGHDIHTAVSLGYRGEYACEDYEGALRELDRRGALYQAHVRRGVVLLPNLARDHGCDALVLNTGREALEEFVRAPVLETALDRARPRELF